jgi:hypothetical protein
MVTLRCTRLAVLKHVDGHDRRPSLAFGTRIWAPMTGRPAPAEGGAGVSRRLGVAPKSARFTVGSLRVSTPRTCGMPGRCSTRSEVRRLQGGFLPPPDLPARGVPRTGARLRLAPRRQKMARGEPARAWGQLRGSASTSLRIPSVTHHPCCVPSVNTSRPASSSLRAEVLPGSASPRCRDFP